MVDIYVDADACPVKDETIRVATRHGLKTHLVSDGGICPSQNPLVELVIVAQGADAADDWIAAIFNKKAGPEGPASFTGRHQRGAWEAQGGRSLWHVHITMICRRLQ